MSRKTSRNGVAALVAGVLLLAAPTSASACENEGAAPPELSTEDARDAVLCLINERRKKQGLKRLRSNGSLKAAAQSHSSAMDAANFFSHNGANGSSPLSRIRSTGYLGGAGNWGIAENIRWGEGSLASPKAAVSAWMRSAGHRQAMLGRYREVGVGVALGSPAGGGGDAAIYTADFGYRG
jgi:uncharacterized protein YkwD